MSEIEPEDRGSAALIRSLFAPGDEDVIQWRPRELAGILTQEARCPLQCLPGNSNLTFFELMDCDHADPETLRAVKTWAKLMMMAESAISLVVGILVVARAVNILK